MVTNTGDNVIEAFVNLAIADIQTSKEEKFSPVKITGYPHASRIVKLQLLAELAKGKYALAAIVASALIELSQLEDDRTKAEIYLKLSISMLKELSTKKYQSRKTNSSFLQHSVGNYSKKQEIDASIIYADYYYLEALTRYKKHITRAL